MGDSEGNSQKQLEISKERLLLIILGILRGMDKTNLTLDVIKEQCKKKLGKYVLDSKEIEKIIYTLNPQLLNTTSILDGSHPSVASGPAKNSKNFKYQVSKFYTSRQITNEREVDVKNSSVEPQIPFQNVLLTNFVVNTTVTNNIALNGRTFKNHRNCVTKYVPTKKDETIAKYTKDDEETSKSLVQKYRLRNVKRSNVPPADIIYKFNKIKPSKNPQNLINTSREKKCLQEPLLQNNELTDEVDEKKQNPTFTIVNENSSEAPKSKKVNLRNNELTNEVDEKKQNTTVTILNENSSEASKSRKVKLQNNELADEVDRKEQNKTVAIAHENSSEVPKSKKTKVRKNELADEVVRIEQSQIVSIVHENSSEAPKFKKVKLRKNELTDEVVSKEQNQIVSIVHENSSEAPKFKKVKPQKNELADEVVRKEQIETVAIVHENSSEAPKFKKVKLQNNELTDEVGRKEHNEIVAIVNGNSSQAQDFKKVKLQNNELTDEVDDKKQNPTVTIINENSSEAPKSKKVKNQQNGELTDAFCGYTEVQKSAKKTKNGKNQEDSPSTFTRKKKVGMEPSNNDEKNDISQSPAKTQTGDENQHSYNPRVTRQKLQSNIEFLIGMGYDAIEAEEALKQSRHSLQDALELLITADNKQHKSDGYQEGQTIKLNGIS